ncbi:MAG: glycosyltransferase [Gemmatimonadetes bacterium]|nr:glycosyltransferase [Gemmatimonadota bacterium]
MRPALDDSSSAVRPDQLARLSDRMRREFAVVVPAYNEAPVIPDLVRELRRTFETHGLAGEIILVDDGSTDDTGEVARREARDWPAFRVISHRANCGKTEAMLTAAQATDREYLILFDADLQHSPAEIPRLLEKLEEGWDIVCGRKIGYYDKRAVSSAYNWLSRRVFRVPASDLNSIKAFRKSILNEIQLRHDWHRFFVVLAYARGYSVTEMDVFLYPRRAGKSKYTGQFRIVVGLLDLMSVWFLLVFSRKPLLLFGLSGLILITLGLAVGAVAFYLRFAHELGFRPLLYLVILFETVGFLLFGFGLMAEMIAQLGAELEAVQRRLR